MGMATMQELEAQDVAGAELHRPFTVEA